MIQTVHAVMELMVVHVVLAGGGTNVHHQILLLLLWPVPLCPILRVAVLHHQDAPSARRRVVLREAGRHLLHHDRRQRRWRRAPAVRRDGGVPQAQVAAAAVDASLLRAAVVVADAFAFGAPEFMKLVEVLRQGSVAQVARRGVAQGAELVVRRLKAGLEEGGVKLISVDATR